ncbi:hypothetical protein [Roseobacter sinensis]|uniref:Lipoprotein n=1 Tax=Roseobacter sinensis TaxID=2931391 RepID=A0ABT3BAG9_9RHOB|nr:hypothetical protein [Roseobacter sp. WL0113]MCV3270571.1 hypothetical protein [Roseobacter sp. WL0113]
MGHMFGGALCALGLLASGAVACDDRVGDRIATNSDAFKSSADVFYGDAIMPLRVAAYETLLRTNEPVFGAMVEEGKASQVTALFNTAVFCEMFRANGFFVRVTGLPPDAGALTEPQKAQILGRAYQLPVVERHYDEGCISTYANREAGCHPSYFVSASGGVIRFARDRESGEFRWVDGEYIGTMNVWTGSGYVATPASLQLQ